MAQKTHEHNFSIIDRGEEEDSFTTDSSKAYIILCPCGETRIINVDNRSYETMREVSKGNTGALPKLIVR